MRFRSTSICWNGHVRFTEILADISLALTYDLYSYYIEFLPLLAPNAMTWSFSLVTSFFHALPSELQETIQSGGYVLLDLSTLLTSYLQEQELQRLLEQAVAAHMLLEDEGKRIRKLMTTFGTIHGFAINGLQMESDCLNSNSLVEHTL